MMRMRLFLAIGLTLALFFLSGCINRLITRAIVEAPNLRATPWILGPQGEQQLRKIDRTYAEAWMVSVGPPEAKLSVAVIDPGDYKMVHTIETGIYHNGRAPVWPKTEWTEPQPKTPAQTPKATILILHGYQDCKEDMLHWAFLLAQHGYRVVLVDLRGHGRSTGSWIGFGAFEAHDLGQVLDDLEKHRLIAGSLGVMGLSYGASMGLQLAGRDPRVQAVVALEPFSEPRGAVVDFAHAVVPERVKSWTPADFSGAEDRAGRLAQFSWEAADVMGSVAKTHSPILYVCAKNDHWVPSENSRKLATATRAIHSVMTVTFTADGGLENHVLLSWILDPIASPVLKWFEECLTKPSEDLKERLKALEFPVDP